MNAPGEGVGSNAFDEGGWRGKDKPKAKAAKAGKKSERQLRVDLVAKQRAVKELEVPTHPPLRLRWDGVDMCAVTTRSWLGRH